VIAYKFLRTDGTSAFTGFRWELPEDSPGDWVKAPIDACRSGIHACRSSDLPLWSGRRLYEIELQGDIVERPSKIVASQGRLLREVATWDDELREAYTRMCADRAHELALSTTPPLADWDAFVEPSVPAGPALLGFLSARIAEERAGPDAFRAERATQARWLTERLGLEA
jgi:hypothetical protein